jgi:hypothetical protein
MSHRFGPIIETCYSQIKGQRVIYKEILKSEESNRTGLFRVFRMVFTIRTLELNPTVELRLLG